MLIPEAAPCWNLRRSLRQTESRQTFLCHNASTIKTTGMLPSSRRKIGQSNLRTGSCPADVVVTECLTRYLPARATKLIFNVISGFFDSLGSSGAWSEIDKPLNMSKGFLAGEFLPDLWGLRLRHQCRKQQKRNQSRECNCTVHRFRTSMIQLFHEAGPEQNQVSLGGSPRAVTIRWRSSVP